MEKSVLKSKTFWFGLISGIAPLFPAVSTFLSENPTAISMVWGSLAIVLRLATKDKVVLID